MGKLAKTVYGDALFDLAKDRDQIEEIMAEVSAMKEILRDHPDFSRIMAHPHIHTAEKQALLEAVFSGRAEENMLGFLHLITEKGHFQQLPGILDRYEERYRAFHGIGIARIVSAVPLTKDQKEKVEKKLAETTGYRQILPEYQVDPALIGGVVIRIGDRVVDGSIQNKLNRLTKELTDMQLASHQ